MGSRRRQGGVPPDVGGVGRMQQVTDRMERPPEPVQQGGPRLVIVRYKLVGCPYCGSLRYWSRRSKNGIHYVTCKSCLKNYGRQVID